MKQDVISKRLLEMGSIMKEGDGIYRDAAKALGMSDCAFWILYSLRCDSDALTQSNICSTMFQPKQTVNSALKKLRDDGYIDMADTLDHRGKLIRLTPKGIKLVEKTIDLVVAAEYETLRGLPEDEQSELIRLLRKHTSLLKKHVEANISGRPES